MRHAPRSKVMWRTWTVHTGGVYQGSGREAPLDRRTARGAGSTSPIPPVTARARPLRRRGGLRWTTTGQRAVDRLRSPARHRAVLARAEWWALESAQRTRPTWDGQPRRDSMARQPDTTRVHGVVAALDQRGRQWLRRAGKRVKLPQGNAIVLAVLRSRAHRLLSASAIELRYTGRRSGRQYVLPVQYAGTGDRLVVRPQHWQHSTWWRNFRTPQPVTVRLAGRLHEGTADRKSVV